MSDPDREASGNAAAVNRILPALAFARRYSRELLYLMLSALILWWVTWEAFYVRGITFSPSADYWEHSATLRALLDNPWHPKNPHLVSLASSPRFGPQFVLIALLGRALHLDALGAMSLAACLNTLLLLVGIYTFFRAYFRDSWAPVYGLLVLFTSWWHAWSYSNVYQLVVFVRVASYPSTTALGLTLLDFALALHVLRAVHRPRWSAALLVLSVACVFIVHQLTAVMSLSGIVLLALTEPKVTWQRRAELCAGVLLGGILAAFWPYFSPWKVLAGGNDQSVNHWASESVQSAVHGSFVEKPHRFYRWGELLDALGLSALGLLFMPYFFCNRRRLFVGLGALSMLLPFVVNRFVALPLGHRFILLAMLYLQVAVVWLFLKLTAGSTEAVSFLDRPWRKRLAASAIACVLAICLFHNLSLAYADTLENRHTEESPYAQGARAAANAAGPRAVVLADPLVSWSLPTFGPKVLVLQHPNPLVPDEPEREHDVRLFLSRTGDSDARQHILTQYGVTHVLTKGAARGPLAQFLAEHASHQILPAGYNLYTLGAH
jgi:hypothetical protein